MIPLSLRSADQVKHFLLAIVMMCPLTSWSQEIKPLDVKVGLWETSVTTELSGLPAMPPMSLSEEELAKIPAAQRAQVEAAMKGRGSMGRPQTTSQKQCVTRETLNRSMYRGSDKTCTAKVVSATSSTQQIHIECSPSGTKAAGDMTLERVDSEHIKGTMHMKTSGGNAGRSVDVKMTTSGKWLSSDCGGVKPSDEK
jgi:Protein of unknown function (DUF3617)